MSSSEHKSGRAWKALEWLCIKRPLLLQTAGLGGLEVLVQAIQTSARFTDGRVKLGTGIFESAVQGDAGRICQLAPLSLMSELRTSHAE